MTWISLLVMGSSFKGLALSTPRSASSLGSEHPLLPGKDTGIDFAREYELAKGIEGADHFGGTAGIRDLGLLEAALGFSLIQNHPFLDGLRGPLDPPRWQWTQDLLQPHHYTQCPAASDP
jgi:hypothetical protein